MPTVKTVGIFYLPGWKIQGMLDISFVRSDANEVCMGFAAGNTAPAHAGRN